jgi:PAS domain S-box-containing protein
MPSGRCPATVAHAIPGEMVHRVLLPLWAGGEVRLKADGAVTASMRQVIRANPHDAEMEHARLAAIIESSADAIITDSVHGTVTSWNPAAERLYGYSEAEAIGRPSSFIGPRDQPDEFGALRTLALSGQRVEHFDTLHTHRNGEAMAVSVTVAPIRLPDGTVLGTSLIARDARARKHALASLARLAQDLQRSNAELEQFAYIASHDLQEPLRMVASYTQLLARRYRGKLDQDADDFINYAVDGAVRMQELINALLEYSRIGTRKRELAPVDLAEPIASALKNLERVLEESGAVVTHDPLPTVTCDSTQMMQLFQNLIANAVKFRREAPLRIHIAATRDGEQWTFSVADNGIGIEPEYLTRIFEIFERLHGRDQYSGTGIGLAVCKRIVERHGGRIWATSTLGEGTTFWFTIPSVAGGGT